MSILLVGYLEVLMGARCCKRTDMKLDPETNVIRSGASFTRLQRCSPPQPPLRPAPTVAAVDSDERRRQPVEEPPRASMSGLLADVAGARPGRQSEYARDERSAVSPRGTRRAHRVQPPHSRSRCARRAPVSHSMLPVVGAAVCLPPAPCAAEPFGGWCRAHSELAHSCAFARSCSARS